MLLPTYASDDSLNMFIQKSILMTLNQTPRKEDLGNQEEKSILSSSIYCLSKTPNITKFHWWTNKTICTEQQIFMTIC